MGTASDRPIAVQPGVGRELTSLGVTHRLTGDQTEEAYYLCEAVFGPENGSPLHIHHREIDVIYVLEGAIEIRLAEEKLLIPAGGIVHLPRGIPHALYNPLKTDLRTMVHAIPAGLEHYFDEMEQAIRSDSLDHDNFLNISTKYGLEWLE